MARVPPVHTGRKVTVLKRVKTAQNREPTRMRRSREALSHLLDMKKVSQHV